MKVCTLVASAAAMVVVMSTSSTVAISQAQTTTPPTGVELFRPQFHFTPAVNWMNDPNGLVFFQGEYHLFYQYNPSANTWGHMSWGHAVSRDLVHWQHLPLAIPELGDEMVFSGSAVVDVTNSSGFGKNGEPPLVAIYTAHNQVKRRQAQALAYSTDRGRTWTRYAKNPVLDRGLADFRDPKVFWHAATQRWIMAVVRSPDHRVQLFGSPDLKQWSLLSDFGPAGAIGGVWECPDLFPLPVDGDPTRTRWVMVVNLNPGAVAGGSGTQYFVGDFDGTRFTTDLAAQGTAQPLWADFGKDFYAAVSWSNDPRADGRRTWIGWMNNWGYANFIPTSPWRSAQSVPRVLSLRTTPAGVRLVQEPVGALTQLRGAVQHVAAQTIIAGTHLLSASGATSAANSAVSGSAIDIVAEFDAGTAAEFGLVVRAGINEETVIGVDRATKRLYVDRTRAGQSTFHPTFASRQYAPIRLTNGRVRVRVLVDWSSVEVFADDGEVVITDQLFPSATSAGVALFAKGGTAKLVSMDAWPMASALAAGAASSGSR